MSILFSKIKEAKEEVAEKAAEEETAAKKAEEDAAAEEKAEEAKHQAEEKTNEEAEGEAAEEEAAKKAAEETVRRENETAVAVQARRDELVGLIDKAAEHEKTGELEAAQESLLAALKQAKELADETGEAEDKERLKDVYRQLAKLGYALNQYYTEQSAKCLIEAVNAQQEQDASREAECRKRGAELSARAAGCMAASQKYDRLLRASR